jgi:hypothetical protein
MLTLRIFLIGLIALIPNEKSGSLGVALLDARNEHTPHLPVVIYNCKNIPDEGARSECGLKDPGECKEDDNECKERSSLISFLGKDGNFDALLLHHDRIFLRGAQPCCGLGNCRGGECEVDYISGRRRLVYDNLISPFMGDAPRTREEAEDISWVPSMSKVSFQSRSFDRDHISQNLPGLAGFLNIDGLKATVSTFGLVDFDQMIPSFTFKKLASGRPITDYRQALADIVLVSLPLGESISKVTIELASDSGWPRKVDLEVNGKDQSIDIVVGNLAPLLTEGVDCEFHGPIVDEHFELYYRLARPATPGYREAEVPFLDKLMTKKVNVEYPPPPIVAFVEGGDKCSRVQQEGGPLPSSSNRPICTQVLMEQ